MTMYFFHAATKIYPHLLSFIVILTLFNLAGCQTTKNDSSHIPLDHDASKPLAHNVTGKSLENLTTFRGHLTYGHEVRSLSLCDKNKELWIIDNTEGEMRRISEGMTHSPYSPIFIEAQGRLTDVPQDGFGAEYEGAIILTDITHASSIEDSWGCREKYDEFIFKGQGNEPGWTCLITKMGITFSSINQEQPITFPASLPSRKNGSTVFKSATENNALKVTISHVECQDSMADELFGWQMELTLNEIVYRGCAKRGDMKQ